MLQNLKAELARSNITVGEVASILEIAQRTVRNKINCVTEFSLSEMFLIRKKLFPNLTLDYLFYDTTRDHIEGGLNSA